MDTLKNIGRGENCSTLNCFICNKYIESGTECNLIFSKVNYSESQVTELLGRLVENDWIVFVSEDDFLCQRCMVLLNQMDELELNLKNVKDKLTDLITYNYNLVSSEFQPASDKIEDDGKSYVDINNGNKNIPEKNTICSKNRDMKFIEQNVNSLLSPKQLFKHFEVSAVKETATPKNEKNEERKNERHNKTLFKCRFCKVTMKGDIPFVQHMNEKHLIKEDKISKSDMMDPLKPSNNDIVCNVEVQINALHKNVNCLTECTKTSLLSNENDVIFCEMCGIPVLEENHNIHMSKHGVSKYSCCSCDKIFSDESIWTNHQEVCKNRMADQSRVEDVNTVNMNYNISDSTEDNGLSIKTEDMLLENNLTADIRGENISSELTYRYNNITNNNKILGEKSLNEHSVDKKTCFNTKSDTETTLTINLEKSLKSEKNESNEHALNVPDAKKSILSEIYKCGVCGFRGSSILILRKHLKNHSQFKRSFKCNYCNLLFTKKTLLHLHVVRRHRNANSRCLFCRKMFIDKTHLNVHIEKYHLDVKMKPFCTYCGKMLTTERDLKTHILRHHFNDYDDQFSEEMALKNDLTSIDFLNKHDSQNLINTPSSSIVLNEANYQEEEKKTSLSSFCVKSEQKLQEEPLSIYCAMCEFTSKEDSEMLKHIVCHQTTDNHFCKICCEYFCSKTFIGHLNHRLESQSLQCKYCNDQFHDALHLKFHIKSTHHEVDIYSCKHCNKIYTDKSALMKHIKTKHVPKKAEKSCNLCKISFKNDRHYSNHVEYAHRTTLDCKICGKELTNWKKLQYHEKAHLKHSKTNYKCDICNKVLKTQTGLRFHKIRHTGNFPFFCEFCGQGFVSTHSLTEHIGHHTKETRYTCDVCGKGFYFYDTMYRHRILHDNPYPKTCNICNKSFRNSSRVAIHKRREHTGERPYKCTYCPQSFFTSNGYKHHLCLHTKVFPYNCKPCNKGFTTRHKYAIHLSRKHSDHTLLINRAPNNKEWNEQWLK